jgi:hypothetical protein
MSKEKVTECSMGIERDQRYPAINPGRKVAAEEWANGNKGHWR